MFDGELSKAIGLFLVVMLVIVGLLWVWGSYWESLMKCPLCNNEFVYDLWCNNCKMSKNNCIEKHSYHEFVEKVLKDEFESIRKTNTCLGILSIFFAVFMLIITIMTALRF